MPEYGNSTAADTPPPHQAIHDMTDDFGKAPVKTACEIHSLPGTRGKHLLETLEQAHVFVNLLLLAEMPVTRALPVYTERTEFLPDIIPIRPQQTAYPIFRVEELAQVFRKHANLLDERPSHHDKTRLSYNILFQSFFEPRI